jgi:hypothetical protein
VRVYVVAFGLAPSVAARWSELETARAGFGVAQRIADALYESGSFTFLEEKAEVVARLDELLERQPADSAARTSLAEAGAPWLLYGEIVDLVTERAEIVRGLSGRGEVETRVTVQLRLVERASGRFHPATGTGASRAPSRSDTLDPVAVAEATNEAVGRAALALLERLRGDG